MMNRITPGRSLLLIALLVVVYAVGEIFQGSLPAAAGPVEASETPEKASEAASDTVAVGAEIPVYGNWRNFSTADGLPSNKVFCIRVDGDRVWAGTDDGLARYENGRWSTMGVSDGLPHRAILSLDVSPQTGDLWIGTMGGMARYSAGKIDVFKQISSGLSNDFVNEVQCDPEESAVWAATAMGLSRYDVRSGSWEIFTHENTPMHEPWTYSVAVEKGLVYVGAWGAGVLELQKASGTWREYRDPDKEMEIDLLPNDGPVHDVTSAIDFQSGILWQASYMGLARYDGRLWNSYYKEDSGLASNFINFVRSSGPMVWLCTDDGLTITDSQYWATYRRTGPEGGEVLFYHGNQVRERRPLSSVFAHNFVLGVDFAPEGIWLATHGGVSFGIRMGSWKVKELEVPRK